MKLSDPTPREAIHSKPGRGSSGALSYVTARFVMDRLDEAVGPENWQDRYEDRPDGSVRCGIGIRFDTEWVWKWDVGTESDIESEKGVHSDAFKRAGVKWGIARDLYDGATTHAGQGSSSPRPAASPAPRPTAPLPSAGAVPEEPEYLREAIVDRPPPQQLRTPRDAEAHEEGAFCPTHGLAWTLRPGGISKASGKPYDPFYACPSTEMPYCKQRPSKRWLAIQEVA